MALFQFDPDNPAEWEKVDRLRTFWQGAEFANAQMQSRVPVAHPASANLKIAGPSPDSLVDQMLRPTPQPSNGRDDGMLQGSGVPAEPAPVQPAPAVTRPARGPGAAKPAAETQTWRGPNPLPGGAKFIERLAEGWQPSPELLAKHNEALAASGAPPVSAPAATARPGLPKVPAGLTRPKRGPGANAEAPAVAMPPTQSTPPTSREEISVEDLKAKYAALFLPGTEAIQQKMTQIFRAPTWPDGTPRPGTPWTRAENVPDGSRRRLLELIEAAVNPI